MTAEQKFRKLYEEMFDLCEENGWGDPFSYARSKEIHMAGLLGHKVSDTLSGADAYEQDGNPTEYKSTIGPRMIAAYNAISIQPTWKEQVDYLKKEKIAKYQNHYHARYDGGKVVEMYKLKGDDVLKLLLPKLKRAYDRMSNGQYGLKKDPRLGATLSMKEIRKHGKKVSCK